MLTDAVGRSEFSQLLADRLLKAGERRPLEPGLQPFQLAARRGGVAETVVPLDPFYEMYRAAPQPADREFVIQQFLDYWMAAGGDNPFAAGRPSASGRPAPAEALPPVALPPVALPRNAHAQPAGTPVLPAWMPRRRPSRLSPLTRIMLTGALALFITVTGTLVLAGFALLRLVAENARQGPAAPIIGAEPTVPLPSSAKLTIQLGGQGGGLRTLVDNQERAVVGFRYKLDHWDNRQVIGRLEPIFERQPPQVGRPDESEITVLADEGYVVGGLLVDATNLVNAVKVRFVREQAGELNLEDTYETPWLGIPTGCEPQLLGGKGETVLGLHLRQGLVLDAIGLVVRPSPSEAKEAELP